MQINDKETQALCDAVKAVLGENAKDYKPKRGGKGHDDFIDLHTINVEEGNEFTAAAAKAAVAGDKEFEFDGKTYPSEMDIEVAKKILGESSENEVEEAFSRLPGNVINNELYTANRALQAFVTSQKNGDDVDEKRLNLLINNLQAIKKQIKKFNKPEDIPVKYQYKESVDLEEGIDFSKVKDGQLKAWLAKFKNMKSHDFEFINDVKAAEKEAKKRGLTESSENDLEEAIDFSKVKDDQLKAWLDRFNNVKSKFGPKTVGPWDGFKDDVKAAEKEAKKRGLTESSEKLITKRQWDKADEDQRDAWLSGAFEDPDDIDKHINAKWQDLPPQATSNMYESVELNEGVADIVKKVEKLKVGDKTNFGVVKEISANSITFKAKDTPKTKILFKQPKLGSRDFVLDQLVKLTPDGKRLAKESTDLEEATMSQGVKQAQKHIDSLESSLKKGSNLNKGINKALEGKYDADFIKMEKAMSQILDVWQDIEYEFAQSVGESVELDEAIKAGSGKITVHAERGMSKWELVGSAERKYKIKLKVTPAKFAGHSDSVSVTGDKKNVLAYLQSGDYGVDISGRPSSKGLPDGDIKDAFPEILETYDDSCVLEDTELDEAIAEIVKEENLDIDSLSEEQLDELLGGALKKLGGAIKSRVTTSGRADRAEKKADKGDKKAKDRARLMKAKARIAAQKKKKIALKAREKAKKAKARQESVELDEASESDLKKILAAAKKAGGRVKGNTVDFGMGASIEFSIEKGKIKFDGGRATGVGYFDNVDDALASLAAGLG